MIGLGFEISTIPPEEAIEHDYRCAFHKIVPEGEQISADYCDEPVCFAVARMSDEDMVVMCHTHFQRFAADMVEACIRFADEDTLAEEPEVLVNTELKEAATMHGTMNLASSIIYLKHLKEGANQ
jgi:hypothetical protein